MKKANRRSERSEVTERSDRPGSSSRRFVTHERARFPTGFFATLRMTSGRVFADLFRKMRSFALILLVPVVACAAEHALVLQTDFGTKDGAVAAMRGVAVGVSPKLSIYDL